MKATNLLRGFIKAALLLILVICWVWGGFALYLSVPGPQWLRTVLIGVFFILLPGSVLLSHKYFRAVFLYPGVFAVLLIWWQTLELTNDKD
jgi:hypothetical protein